MMTPAFKSALDLTDPGRGYNGAWEPVLFPGEAGQYDHAEATPDRRILCFDDCLPGTHYILGDILDQWYRGIALVPGSDNIIEEAGRRLPREAS